MKVKHLKTKTTIELTPEELDKYIECVKHLDNTVSTLFECQDMFISDLRELETLSWRLREVFGLTRKDYKYIKENYSD